MKHLIAPGLALLVGVGILLLIPHEVPEAGGDDRSIGSRTLPYTLAAIIALAGLLELVRISYALFRSRSGAGTRSLELLVPAPTAHADKGIQVLILGVTVLWAYTLTVLGHFIVSTFLCIVIAGAFGARNPVRLGVYTLGLVVPTYILFSEILGVRLPGLGGVFS